MRPASARTGWCSPPASGSPSRTATPSTRRSCSPSPSRNPPTTTTCRCCWPRSRTRPIAAAERRGTAMQYRPLGRTGLTVSEIGYGAWGIGGAGWVGAREDESVRALHRAIELGVTFIDTARGYGESERIVGAVVRDHPGEELLVATKVPPKNDAFPAPAGVDPAEVFSGTHIRDSVHESLRAS